MKTTPEQRACWCKPPQMDIAKLELCDDIDALVKREADLLTFLRKWENEHGNTITHKEAANLADRKFDELAAMLEE